MQINNQGLWRARGAILDYRKLQNGDIAMRGLGVVFSKPDADGNIDRRDFYGEYFMPPPEYFGSKGDSDAPDIGTDYFIGPDESSGALIYPGKEVPLMWDHGSGNLGSRVLGKAVFREVTPEGLEWLILVEKAKAREYAELVDELRNEGYLGLSSQTLSSMARGDWWSGAIKAWAIAEMTLTVTPAEPRTIDWLQQRAKSLGLPILKSEESRMNEPIKEQGATEVVSGDELGTIALPDDQRSLVDELNEVFDDVEDNVARTQMDSEMSTLLRALDGILKRVEALQEAVDAMNERSVSVEDFSSFRTNVDTQFTTFGEAIKVFGRRVGETVGKYVDQRAQEELLARSSTELDAMRVEDQPAQRPRRERSTRYGIPTDAPGQ